jgi:hypothetical protein
VDAVITRPRWRQTLWRGEDVVERLKQARQQCRLQAAHGMQAACQRDVRAGRSHTLPEDAAALVPERHAQIIEVP